MNFSETAQVFMGNSIPANQIGVGADEDSLEEPSSTYWTQLPVDNTETSFPDSIVLVENSRRINELYGEEEINYFAIVDPSKLLEHARGARLKDVKFFNTTCCSKSYDLAYDY
nr:uncharacterized protein LOC107447345 [Parasteatoda tepidariorum]